MAKKKKAKENKSLGYSVELTGLSLILLGIIGFGFGNIGTLIKKFSMFIGGTFWFLVLGIVIYLGFYMLLKRQMPKFFSPKLIGVYILLIVLLAFNHVDFLNEEININDIFVATYDNYIKRMNTISSLNALSSSGTSTIIIGGGLIGCIFISIFNFIGGIVGAKIILIALLVFGLILAFDLNISEMLSNMINSIKKLFSKKNNIKTEVIEVNEDNIDEHVSDDHLVNEVVSNEVIDNRIIISSIDDIKNGVVKKEEIVNEVIEDEPIISTSLGYTLPDAKLLDIKKNDKVNLNLEENNKKKFLLERVMRDFGISIKIVDMHVGPAVTQFEITVPHGTKVNKILSINKEIALAMAAKNVRIEAPIPGKSTIGIEIPNGSITMVGFREVIEPELTKKDFKLFVALGKDLMGRRIFEDLTKTPHLLVAGSTGSGKSVCINTIISSILMRYKPDEVKLVMVDPKKVELTNYNGIPHLLCPVVSDPKKASLTLQKIVSEMEKRYDIFSDNEVKNISTYNDFVEKYNKKNGATPKDKMPYILVIIDELADLMLVASKEVEDSIMRITQMARAAGIHLIVATQRPSTDVITGLIKNNIPSRIAFSVSSSIDSRTILDMSGAEKLLGKGDMLYLPMGESTPKRIQGCFISDDEIKNIINHCKKEMKVCYNEELVSAEPVTQASGSGNSEAEDDVMYNEVVEFAVETGKISASLIQRRFRFGYNRAARMMDLLESRGIVGPQNGSKPRDVLVKLENNQ